MEASIIELKKHFQSATVKNSTMLLDRLILFAKRLENPDCPLLGPNLKGLYLCGLWQRGRSRLSIIMWNTFHIASMFFVLSQVTELHMLRQDLNKALYNFSLTTTSGICSAKVLSFILFQSRWSNLINNISQEEKTRNNKDSPKMLAEVEKCTNYARMMTYSYWALLFATNLLLISAPLIKYGSSASYREDISSGVESYPLILSSWFPFNELKTPGYYYACAVHVIMSIQGTAIVAVYDTNAWAIMTFLKGQMVILKNKCAEIFDSETNDDQTLYLATIKECHRHHNFLLKQYELFDSLVSPVMFLYVLMCSVTICCSVIQLNLSETTPSQRLWVIEYSIGQIVQLFMFCWHANEVNVESQEIDRGVYASDWWKADVRVRKQVLLLACKLDCPLPLNAGPFTRLCIPTFVNIIKGSYSFYTLFSQFQE